MQIKNLGLINYPAALSLMAELHAQVAALATHPGFLLVLQHPPTVTMGHRELLHDLKISPAQLESKAIAYYKTDRGGSVTVHEPGQVVIYPLINLSYYRLSLRSFIYALEQAMIETCAHYNICATRNDLNPGVWINSNKIGAVGIRIKNKVTKHGLAFNVINSLATFSFVVPCGLRNTGITNLLQCNKNLIDNNKDMIDFYYAVESFLTKKLQTLLLNPQP